MLGEGEPLKALHDASTRDHVVERILREFSERTRSPPQPILYASQDVVVCVHECRVTVEDDRCMATLAPVRELRLLDLTAVLEEDVTEFAIEPQRIRLSALATGNDRLAEHESWLVR